MSKFVVSKFEYEDNINCLNSCVVQMLQNSNRKDILDVILKPLGFLFGVSLGTRDWWLGGYSEENCGCPTFQRGLTGKWVNWRKEELQKKISEYIKSGHFVIFRTEWSYVYYSSLFGHSLGDIHCAMIVDCNEHGDLTIYDRLGYRRRDIFNSDNIAIINLNDLKIAFSNRFDVFEYNLAESSLSWEEELMDVLKRTIISLENDEDNYIYAPHLHKVTGITGVQYLFNVLKFTPKEYRKDKQTNFLLNVRLPCNTDLIIGNRLLLKLALEDERSLRIMSENQREELIRLIDRSIDTWKLAKTCFKEAANSGDDYSCLDEIGEQCVASENAILSLIKKIVN